MSYLLSLKQAWISRSLSRSQRMTLTSLGDNLLRSPLKVTNFSGTPILLSIYPSYLPAVATITHSISSTNFQMFFENPMFSEQQCSLNNIVLRKFNVHRTSIFFECYNGLAIVGSIESILVCICFGRLGVGKMLSDPSLLEG